MVKFYTILSRKNDFLLPIHYLGQSGPEINDNERVLHIHQSWMGRLTPLQRCSQHILLPLPTGPMCVYIYIYDTYGFIIIISKVNQQHGFHWLSFFISFYWSSLLTSPLGSIQCPHRADECKILPTLVCLYVGVHRRMSLMGLSIVPRSVQHLPKLQDSFRKDVLLLCRGAVCIFHHPSQLSSMHICVYMCIYIYIFYIEIKILWCHYKSISGLWWPSSDGELQFSIWIALGYVYITPGKKRIFLKFKNFELKNSLIFNWKIYFKVEIFTGYFYHHGLFLGLYIYIYICIDEDH